jgi:hypothetical protein
MRLMGRSSRRSVAVVVLLTAFSSCSSTSEPDTSVAPQPVDSARTDTADGAAATFGTPLAIGDLRITASDPVVEADDDGPWLTMAVRAENRTQGDLQSPLFELRCSGSSAGGAWLTISTFKQQEPVPAGSSTEGTVSLLLPGDERLGEPRPSCTTPATVIASLVYFDTEGSGQPVQVRVGWGVPDELIAELNASPPPP